MRNNQRGFSIVEIVTSITIFVIFATGYTLFVQQNNTIEEAEGYLFGSNELIGEAQEAIRNVGASYFSSGSWSLSFTGGSYTFYSGATVGSGLYLDPLGYPISATATGAYKRLIVITPNPNTYTGSTGKPLDITPVSVEIRVWYPGCDFNRTHCVYRNIVTY